MTIKDQAVKLKRFAAKNSNEIALIAGVLTGVIAMQTLYGGQTTLNFGKRVQRCAARGNLIGYEVKGVQYVLVKHKWE